jgi:mRNA interferase RelE/StbE
MTYELHFHPSALKEWKKLSSEIQGQFKKVLRRRLQQPHVASARLNTELKNCYKIKLLKVGYRLVYKVDDNICVILVIAIGKRDKNLAYKIADKRL